MCKYFGAEIMSYFLETTDMDLGDTPIENIFINDYMPMANGTYVKVYLLGYKYAHDRDENINVRNETISRHLDIPLEDVLRAWEFWETKGIIERIYAEDGNKINYKVKFLNLKQLYIRNNIGLLNTKEEEAPESKYSTYDLVDANKVPAINNMFNSIDNIMRRQTVPTEKQKILNWIHDYNMNPDVIEKAFSFGVERRGVKNLRYIEAIIRNWYDKGLTNMEAIMESFKDDDEKYYRYQKIMRALGLDKRPMKDDEKETIDSWFSQYDFSLELVLEACSRDKNPRPSINYVNGILKSWHGKGIKLVEDIENLDKPKEETKAASKRPATKRPSPTVTRFHNFEQRTDKYSSDEINNRIEEIARRKREAYNQRAKGEA